MAEQYLIYDETLTSIADAIRARLTKQSTNLSFSTTPFLPSHMSTYIGYISPISILTPEAASLVTNTLSSFSDPEHLVTSAGSCAFAYADNLKNIELPVCSSISRYTFAGCSISTLSLPVLERMASSACIPLLWSESSWTSERCYIGSIYLPICSQILEGAFCSCMGPLFVSAPVCEILSSYAFRYCDEMKSASFPACTSIYQSCFQGCEALSTATFPVCSIIAQSAFQSCYALSSVSFPKCESINASAFCDCSALSSVTFPADKTVMNNAFRNCTSLKMASFGACSSIASGAFSSCTALVSLYLMGSSVASMAVSASYVFSGTPIYNSSGYIYVPTSLVASYQTASRWSILYNRNSGVFVGV